MVLFETIFSNGVDVGTYFLMVLVAAVSGVLFSWAISFKLKSSKGFYIVDAITPLLIATIVIFASENIGIGAGLAIGGCFFAIRFRSAPGSASEMLALLASMGSGIVFGQGYLAYGVALLLLAAGLYIGLSYLPIFNHKAERAERLLKVTMPEDVNYEEVLKDTLNHYTTEHEVIRVKTSDMGSLYKIEIRIRMKNLSDIKSLIDDVRLTNGNLEVAVMPYVGNNQVL